MFSNFFFLNTSFQVNRLIKKVKMFIDIDGSVLEGGGQILRSAVALSVVLQVPIRIQKIRANRAKGGLAAQHLTGIRLARAMCCGNLENDKLGSTEITLAPCCIRGGNFDADTQTAGSIALLLQVSLPCALFANNTTYLNLRGGTNADFAPPIDYVDLVLKPMLAKFGAKFEVEVVMRGFIQGNGVVNVTAEPVKKLTPINLLDIGKVEIIRGIAYVAGVLPLRVAEDMARAAGNILQKATNALTFIHPIKFDETEAFGSGTGITIVAKTSTGCFLGSSNLGKKGIRARDVGAKAAEMLLECLNKKYCVDQHMQDQLILFMALADGKSRVKVGPITSHTETAIYITELLTNAKFNIIKMEDGTNIIECDGIGLENKYLDL